jgi:hypothetical protein
MGKDENSMARLEDVFFSQMVSLLIGSNIRWGDA